MEPRDVPSGLPPTAMGIEGLTVLHGQTIANINLIGQCSDPENDPLDIEIVNYPNHGMVIFNYTTSLYEYQAFMTDVGPDSFTFRAFDGTSYSNLATVSITITNTPPVAGDLGTLYILHGQTIDNIDLWGSSSDADNDDIAITIVDYPTYGMVIYNETTGLYEYTAFGNYAGPDSFTYRAHDGAEESNLGTVTIEVTNTPPVAIDDEGYVPDLEDSTTGNVLTNDYDSDGDILTILAVNGSESGVGSIVAGTYGFLQLFSDGSYIYTLNYESPGIDAITDEAMIYDTFAYSVEDGLGGTSQAILTVQARIIRMTISFAPIPYRKGQNPPVRIRVEINAKVANTALSVRLDSITGTPVPYYTAAEGGELFNQADNPIMSGNGVVVIWIPVDSLPNGIHTLVAGRRRADGSIDANRQPLPARTQDTFNVLPP